MRITIRSTQVAILGRRGPGRSMSYGGTRSCGAEPMRGVGRDGACENHYQKYPRQAPGRDGPAGRCAGVHAPHEILRRRANAAHARGRTGRMGCSLARRAGRRGTGDGRRGPCPTPDLVAPSRCARWDGPDGVLSGGTGHGTVRRGPCPTRPPPQGGTPPIVIPLVMYFFPIGPYRRPL